MIETFYVGDLKVHGIKGRAGASTPSMPELSTAGFTGLTNWHDVVRESSPFPTRGRLALWMALLWLAFDFSGQVMAQTQIVNCDAPVQSRKRGIAVNNPFSSADMQALAPGVSWFYDWGVNNWTIPSGVAMSYIPMAWNGNSSFQTSLSSYLAAGNRPWRVFAINEPTFKDRLS
ncbi:MAG TPA: glycosyl hydrolase [Verrucomicrobiae bacterium]